MRLILPMRFFLMIVGFLAAAVGIAGAADEGRLRDQPVFLAFLVAGAVFFAIGAATEDLVTEMRRGRKGVGESGAPVEGKDQQRDV